MSASVSHCHFSSVQNRSAQCGTPLLVEISVPHNKCNLEHTCYVKSTYLNTNIRKALLNLFLVLFVLYFVAENNTQISLGVTLLELKRQLLRCDVIGSSRDTICFTETFSMCEASSLRLVSCWSPGTAFDMIQALSINLKCSHYSSVHTVCMRECVCVCVCLLNSPTERNSQSLTYSAL